MSAAVEGNAQLPQSLADAARSESAMLRFVLEQLPLGLCVFDGQDRLIFCNQRYLTIWGLPASLALPGTTFAAVMAQTRGVETERSRNQAKPLPGSTSTRRREWQQEDGRRIEVVVTRLPDGSCVALHEDVTEQRAAQERVVYMAMHDGLTGLANRAAFHEALEAQLKRHARGEDLAVLCLDLDRFKPVNDTYGHPTGDQVLQEVAQRLRACSRQTDIVARLGGDEFAIVQCGQHQPAAATHLAKRLVQAVAEPIVLAEQVLHIGASVGIAIAPLAGDDATTLHKNADLALYRAKHDGRGSFRYFEAGFDCGATNRRR